MFSIVNSIDILSSARELPSDVIGTISQSVFEGGKNAIHAFSAKSLVIKDCTFKNHIPRQGSGEVIQAEMKNDSYLEIMNSVFSNNRAIKNSGAFAYFDGGQVGVGGAVYATPSGQIHLKDRALILIKNCTFINNTASRHGGSVYIGRNIHLKVKASTLRNASPWYKGISTTLTVDVYSWMMLT